MPRFDKIRADIEMDLSVLRVAYRSPARRAAVLDLLRRTRALLLFGDIGVAGMVRTISIACEDAAAEIRKGAHPEAAVRREIRALARHRLRIPRRGGEGPLLHRALLEDDEAMMHLVHAAGAAAERDPKAGLVGANINLATRKIGLGATGRVRSVRDASEDAGALAVRRNVREAAKRAAED